MLNCGVIEIKLISVLFLLYKEKRIGVTSNISTSSPWQVACYLVYEGVVMQEELERAVRLGENNLLPHVRRLHLVVTALREFFIALEICLKKEQNVLDSKHLLHIKGLPDPLFQ